MIYTYTYRKQSEAIEYSIDLIQSFSFWSRFLGLMGKQTTNLGMIFNRTKQVHMFFMRFPIDVFFLDSSGTVIDIQYDLRPWKISKYVSDAAYVIEFAAGRQKHIQIGDQFRLM